MKRYRCSQCDKIVDEARLVKHSKTKLLEKFLDEQTGLPSAFAQRKLEARYHQVWGRFGYDTCGPVEVEEISDYQECFEHFFGVTL